MLTSIGIVSANADMSDVLFKSVLMKLKRILKYGINIWSQWKM